ncbi:SEL1-like repeat protein [Clostridium cellulovorans]|nr:sel1 repeat family protein [Clostridium cellulovorans]
MEKDINNRVFFGKKKSDFGDIRENDDFIDPFGLEKQDIIEEKGNTDPFVKDQFETSFEFKERIEDIGKIILGKAIIEKNKEDKTTGLLAFKVMISKEITIKNRDFDVFYIDTKEEDIDRIFRDSQQITANLIARLKVIDNAAYIDEKRVYLDCEGKLIKVNAVSLRMHIDETIYDFHARIVNLPDINIGVARLIKSKYDIDTEIFPVALYYYKWLDNVEKFENGYLELDRFVSREIYNISSYHDLYGNFEIEDNRVRVARVYMKVKNSKRILEFDLLNSKYIGDIKPGHKDDKETLVELKAKAEAGDVISRVQLGDMYYNGQGVVCNYEEALKYYKKASESGHGRSSYVVGDMYYRGKGVEINTLTALEYFKKAVDENYGEAAFKVATFYLNGKNVSKDNKEAMKWLIKAHELRQNVATYKIASMYFSGIGVEKNLKEAFKWFYIAAERGDIKSAFKVAFMYYKGRGVERDYDEALKWYKVAADNNNVDALYWLGEIYYIGKGIQKNNERAMRYFKKAAALGDTRAKNKIAQIEAKPAMEINAEQEINPN